MLTRKYFNAIAAVLKRYRTQALQEGELGAVRYLRDVSDSLSIELADTNPNFDRARFRKACEEDA